MKNNQLNFSINRDQLLKKGYVVIRNFFNEKESEDLKKIIYTVHKNFNEKHSPIENSYTEVTGMHRYKEYWDFIYNKKILETLKYIIGEDIYYLYNSNSRLTTDQDNLDRHDYNWHRDSACRLFGVGPDWDKDEIYKVVRVGIYLFDSKDIKSGLNIIPNTHRTKYNFDNILRIIHLRFKNIKNKYARFFSSILSNFIGLDIETNKGDIIIFLANLMHSEIPAKKRGRVSAFLSYGPNNKHSKNYVNYYMMHRKGYAMPEEYAKQFFDLLRDKNIFFPMPEKKEEVKGFSIPSVDR
jgi:hypothetical protein